MDRPRITAEHGLVQAGMTVDQYLWQAEEMIDKRLGSGFAKSHPELLAACIIAQAQDYHALVVLEGAHVTAEAIRDITSEIARYVDNSTLTTPKHE
jgi:hypothetical protein